MEPGTEVAYKVTAYHSREHDRGIRWDDPALGIAWPVEPRAAVLSDKDCGLPVMEEATEAALFEFAEEAAMKLMVTGGAGFIGSAFVRMMVRERGHEVLNVDKLTYAASPEALERSRATRATACCGRTSASVRRSPRRSPRSPRTRWSASRPESRRPLDRRAWRAFVTTNVVGTCVMLEEALAYWRGLPPERGTGSASSTSPPTRSTAPWATEGRFTETSRYDPNSPYAASKAGQAISRALAPPTACR